MAFNIGDHVIYEDADGRIKGEILDIWKNKQGIITGYFVALNSGIYVQFQSHNKKWSKAEKPVLIA